MIMTIFSIALSLYLLIGVLIMTFVVHCGRQSGNTTISQYIIIKGIVVWCLILPDVWKLVWITIRMTFYRFRAEYYRQQIEKSEKKFARLK